MATNDYSPKHEAHVSEHPAEVADEPWINEDEATQYTYVSDWDADSAEKEQRNG